MNPGLIRRTADLAALLVGIGSLSAAPVDILTNAGLEPPYAAVNVSNANGTVAGLKPTGWSDGSTFTGSHTDTVYAEETADTVNGSALKVTAAVQEGQTSGASFQMFQNVPGVAGRSYMAKVWLKGSQNGTVVFRLRQSTSPYTVRATMNCAVTTAWQQFTLNLNPPANEALRLDIFLNNQAMTLWIDELSLTVADGNREWHVSPTGLDTNDGSIDAPFQTLARAVQSLVAGDKLWLRAGTYRETLALTRSGTEANPIAISPWNGENVTLSGCDVVPGPWTATSNSIYTADVPADLGNGYNQIFVDGVMQHQARHPNYGGGNLFSPALASVTVTNAGAATNPNTISSTSFGGQPANFFAGARFCGSVGAGWSWQTAVVTASSGNLLTIDPATKSIWWWPDYTGASNTSDTGSGFVYGLLALLDADGEWHLQTNAGAPHTLHLRIAGAADPSSHLVEMKRRNWCVDINGFNHVSVGGFKTVAGAIRLSGTGNTLHDVDASFLSHYMTWAKGSSNNGGRAEGGGVVVAGTGCVVRNCTIHDTSGSGITTSGGGHRIERNHIFNIDYSGTYASPLSLDGDGDTAVFNTLHDTGRDVLRPLASGQRVMFNELYNAGRLARDLGMIYCYGTNGMDGGGRKSRIAYNWAHDGNPLDPYCKGVYLDNYDRNYVVDHNVVWDFGAAQAGIYINSPTLGHEIYHNTVISTRSYDKGTWTAFPDNNPDASFWTTANHAMIYTAQNNLVTTTPGAAIENVAALDFRPKAGTAAIDAVEAPTTLAWTTTDGSTNVPAGFALAMRYRSQSFSYSELKGQGIVLPSINGWVPDGKPDGGAYERGVKSWVPGVNGWEGMATDAPVAVGARSALLQGVRIAIDPTPVNVRLYWGLTDGGADAAAWSQVMDLGTPTTADVLAVYRQPLTGLTPGTTYYCRWRATTADGDSWGDTQSFSTLNGLVWDAGGGASTNLTLAANWESDPATNLLALSEIATFGSAGSTAVVDGNANFSGIVFNRDANFTIADGAGMLTLGPDGITVTLPTTTARTYAINESDILLAADQTWSVNNNTGAATLNVTGSVSDGAGSFGITKSGSGTLNLSGNNSFDGATMIQSGVLSISNATALGSASGGTTIAATGSTTTGGQLRLSGDITVTEDITITGTTEAGSFARAIENSSGTNTLTGAITLVGTGQIRLGPAAGTLRINGGISRSGTDSGPLMLAAATGSTAIISQAIDTNGSQFNISGGGTVVLNAAGSDIGGTAVFFGASSPNGPVLRLGTDHALPTARNVTLGTSSTSNGADKGTFDLAGFNQTINALIGIRGTGATPSAAGTRRVTNSFTATISTLTVGNGNGTGTFDGLIEDGAGKVALTKVGSGTETLAQPCSYTGDTTVAGGALSIANATLADSADVNLSTGATLNLAFAGSDTIDHLRINGVVQAPGTWGGLASSATNKTALITGTGILNAAGSQPPYDAWALGNGLDGTPGKDASPAGDADRDGAPNLLEYATKMNPAASDPVPQSATRNGAGMDFIYTRNKAATDITFTVEWSDSLGDDWSTSGIGSPVVLDDNGLTQQIKVVVPVGSGVARRFVHLKVTSP